MNVYIKMACGVILRESLNSRVEEDSQRVMGYFCDPDEPINL